MTEFVDTTTTTCKKLSDALKELDSKPFRSLEFFPPRTEAGVETLFKNISRLESTNPLFVDFTWGAGGSTSDLTIDLCSRAIRDHNLNPNIHITCTGLDVNSLDDVLERCKNAGIRNILALRGDPPQGQDTWVMPENGFTSSLDLIKHIKEKYNDYFCIGCAGYPEGHPNSMTEIDSAYKMSRTEEGRHSRSITSTVASYHHGPGDENVEENVILCCKDDAFATEIDYLKQKIAAGAEFIITQMFFDVVVFKSFVTACRENGIKVPIIPGIMLIGNYGGFKRMTKLCKTRVPVEVEKMVESLQHNDDALKMYGIEQGVKVCQELLKFGVAGLHFYTLNSSEMTTQILQQLTF